MQIDTNAARTNVEDKENKHKTLVAVGTTELVLTRAIGRHNLFGRQNLKVEGDQTDVSMQSATVEVCLQAFGTHNLQPANNRQTCE